MVGWHYEFNRHELEKMPGDSGAQGGLACSNPWSRGGGHDRVTEQNQLR